MIIRLIFIVITTLLSNSLLASSNNANVTDPVSFVIVGAEIPDGTVDSQTGTVDSQTNISQEYNTFELGKEPPVTVWTQFPGPKSNVDKPTRISCKTATQFFLQHLVAKGCQKESLIL
jgi:hypothetical protein